MSIIEEVQAAQAESRIGAICGVRRVLDALDPAEADELRQILAEPKSKYMDATIVRVLKARGLHVGREAVSKHRSGGCKCR